MRRKTGIYLENGAWWAYVGNQPVAYIKEHEERAEERIAALLEQEQKEPGSVAPWRAKRKGQKGRKSKASEAGGTVDDTISIRLSELAAQRLARFQRIGETQEAAINRLLESLPPASPDGDHRV